MATREFIDKNGNTWNWEETPEVIAAVKQLHKTSTEKSKSELGTYLIF